MRVSRPRTTQLVLVNGRAPDQRTEFPVCQTHKAFRSAVSKGSLSSIADDAQKMILALQPYNVDPNRENAVMFWIHKLDIIDKHCLGKKFDSDIENWGEL